MSKNLLIICRRPPYGNSLAREAIDIALAAGAFEQDISLLFIGDGLWQLNSQQDSAALALKNHGKALTALPLYGIENIYVQAEALAPRQLSAEALLLPVTVLSQTQIAALIDAADTVLNF
ncbi:sulfurtransferase complex subunit TusC [Dasania marina]|uniref:sulfurtransferase complex subunit TusC n=1 Tax=Dasania marina TaxID=471499 RepID=UPI0003766A76|nr:sulfurtransferase complex subunit TusC [Dasania marina]